MGAVASTQKSLRPTESYVLIGNKESDKTAGVPSPKIDPKDQKSPNGVSH